MPNPLNAEVRRLIFDEVFGDWNIEGQKWLQDEIWNLCQDDDVSDMIIGWTDRLLKNRKTAMRGLFSLLTIALVMEQYFPGRCMMLEPSNN